MPESYSTTSYQTLTTFTAQHNERIFESQLRDRGVLYFAIAEFRDMKMQQDQAKGGHR